MAVWSRRQPSPGHHPGWSRLVRLSSPRARLYGAFAAVYLIWGSTYLAIRIAIESLPPLLMAGTRFALAGTLLYLWERSRGTPRPSPIQWRAAAGIGVFLVLGGNAVVVLAEQ